MIHYAKKGFDVMSNVGNYIKELRLNKGMTQEELGNVIGVKKAAVQKWESGMVQNLKRSTIKHLADFFKVSPAGFIDDDTPSESNSECFSKKETKLLTNFRDLNKDGQEKLLDYADDLAGMDKYKKCPDTEQDVG